MSSTSCRRHGGRGDQTERRNGDDGGAAHRGHGQHDRCAWHRRLAAASRAHHFVPRAQRPRSYEHPGARNTLARYPQGLTAAIETTAEAKFNLVNANFLIESQRISALIQAQSEATTELSENIKKGVENTQDNITSVDSGKLDLIPGLLADHAAVNQKCRDVAGDVLSRMHDTLRQDFLNWTTQASQKIGAVER